MPKAFIYGSCVARDTMTHFPDQWERPTYIARQSMISGTTGPAPIEGEPALKSAFQNRMVEEDIAGTALPQLEETLTSHDIVLLDLVDERHGVYEISPGKYVTRTNELIKTRLIRNQENKPRHIDFATDEHFQIWARAAQKIVAIIQRSGIPAFLIAPPWAAKSNTGTDITWQGGEVSQVNEKFKPYVEYLVGLGISKVTVPETNAVSNENHRWGLTAFHYVDKVYEDMRDQILASIN